LLVLIVDFQRTGELRELLDAMINSIIVREPSNYEIFKIIDDNLAIASISTKTSNLIPRIVEEKEFLIVLDGEIYSGSIEDLLQIPLSLRAVPYGLFNACIFDRQRKELFIISDPYGTRKLFYTFTNGKFILASRLRAFTADPSFPRMIDFQSLVELLTYGYILDDRTIFANIRCLDPGIVLTISLQTGNVHVSRCYESNLEIRLKPLEVVIDELNSLLRYHVNEQIKDLEKIGLFLSGGIDSRLLLATINKDLLDRVYAFTYCYHEDCSDRLIAEEMTSELDINWKFYKINPNVLRDRWKEAITVTDGMIVFHHTHGLYNIYEEISTIIRPDAVLVGYAGEILHGGYIHRDFLRAKNEDEIVREVLRKINTVFQFAELPKLLREEYAKYCTLLELNLKKRFASLPKTANLVNKVDYFFMMNRMRKFISYGLSQINDFFNYRVPLLFVTEYVFSIDPKYRYARRLIKTLFVKHYPELAKYRYTGTGVALNASRIIEIVSQALSLGLKFISKNRIKLWIRPFIDYNEVYRQELRDFVENILLDNTTLTRPYFKAEYISKLLRDFMRGKENNAEKIGVLLTFELWHRLFIDNR